MKDYKHFPRIINRRRSIDFMFKFTLFICCFGALIGIAALKAPNGNIEEMAGKIRVSAHNRAVKLVSGEPTITSDCRSCHLQRVSMLAMF